MSTPFLPNYRDFPVDDPHNLQKQLVNFHNETNNAVNNRTISTFITSIIQDGERWFPASGQQRLRDGQRLVVQVSDSVLTVTHGITMINQITRLYGVFQDGSGNWWPLPYVDLSAANNQINVKVTATQVVVTKGGGSPPSIAEGIIVLEFL